VEVGEPPLVKTAANLFKELVYKNKDRLLAGIICAGWDRVNGGTVWYVFRQKKIRFTPCHRTLRGAIQPATSLSSVLTI